MRILAGLAVIAVLFSAVTVLAVPQRDVESEASLESLIGDTRTITWHYVEGGIEISMWPTVDLDVDEDEYRKGYERVHKLGDDFLTLDRKIAFENGDVLWRRTAIRRDHIAVIKISAPKRLP